MIDLKKYSTFHSPGYVVEIYNNGIEKEIVFGNREIKPEIKACNKDTLYDIASLTKVYTATLVYIAYEEGKININDKVESIDPRFSHLGQVTVLDLLSHNQDIWTDGYLGNAKSKEEFYDILFTAYVKTPFPTYVDAHYMILSTLLETVYQKTYDIILKEKILEPLGLKKTTVNPTGDNIASNNYETLNGKIVEEITPGLIHDTKGRIAKRLGITTGHASIFTTGHELLLFLKSFLNHTLLKSETIDLMLQHTDRNHEYYKILKDIVSDDDINIMYEKALAINPDLQVMRTYNYMGTRYRNAIHVLNDVPAKCSSQAIVFSGYTGPFFVIDFEQKVIVVIMCNVMHNTLLSRTERKHNTELIMNEIWNDYISIK